MCLFVPISLCVSLTLSLYVVLQHCSISRHINPNPRVSSTSAKVPLHVWSCGFMFICPSCVFFFQRHGLLQSPDCCCVPSLGQWDRMHPPSLPPLLATLSWTAVIPVTTVSGDAPPRISHHRGAVISFATTVLLIGHEIIYHIIIH